MDSIEAHMNLHRDELMSSQYHQAALQTGKQIHLEEEEAQVGLQKIPSK